MPCNIENTEIKYIKHNKVTKSTINTKPVGHKPHTTPRSVLRVRHDITKPHTLLNPSNDRLFPAEGAVQHGG
jgi:hypothetical protein